MNSNSLLRGLCLAAVLIAPGITLAQRTGNAEAGKDYLWIEAEQTVSANIPKTMQGSSHGDFLSRGRWLHLSIPPAQLGKVPAEGVDLTYSLHIPSAGPWELWDRLGLEFVRSPFEWRIDRSAWSRVSNRELTTDLMELDRWSEIAWLRLGTPELTAGAHTLEVRIPKTTDKNGKPARILYASDVLVLAKPGVFRPNSRYRPGEVRGAPIDREAAQRVYQAPVPQAPGERTRVNLDGPWQIARADEQLPPPNIAVPMKPPKPPAYYVWTGIPVPSDRNRARPDLLFAHRLWFRTKIVVPAADAGHSFFLTFPQNNLNTTVYVNGQLCGFGRNPFARFDIDLTQAVKPGSTNELWVGIRDAWYGFSNDPQDPMKLRRCFNYPLELFQGGFRRLAYPIWRHPESGILETPVLTVAGPVRVADVFVRPSVSRKMLAVDVTLRNTTGRAASGQLLCAAIDADGHVAKTLPALNFTLAPGKTKTLTAEGAWLAPKLWWPDSPTLYTLRTTIRLRGQVCDVAHTPFGFREWTWSGHDFRLNAIVWHGWADCFTAPNPESWLEFYHQHHERMMRFWGTSWMGMPPDKALDFFDRHGVVVRRSGMLDGEAIGYMAIEEDPHLRELYHSPIKMDLLNNWKDQVIAQVKGERNHPSIMIWSIENEWLYINCINLYRRLMDQFEKVETAVSAAVMKVDPTRPTMSDGGGACRDNSLPVHGNHYVAADWTKWPAIAYEANPTGGGKGRWVWDEERPRFIGEDLFIAGNHPEFSTFGGDAAFTGKQGSLPAAGLLLRMAQQGYRWANYGAWQFWMGQKDADGSQYHYFAPRVALVKQWNWTFGSGQHVLRTVAIFNDTHDVSPITFTWSLTFGGHRFAGNSRTNTVPPGERRMLVLTLPMPKVQRRTEGDFDLALAVAGRQVWTDHKTVSVLDTSLHTNPAGWAALNRRTFCVYDPEHSVTGFLKSHRLAFTTVGNLRQLPSDARVLLIGRDALTQSEATSSALSAWAAPGRSVVVLEQAEPLCYQALPCEMAPAENTGRVAFIEDASHPVVAGLKDRDFFTWGTDQVLYHNAYLKPVRGAKSLIQCDDRLRNSALVEVPADKGLLLLTQLNVAGKLATVAPAQKLLENMLAYAARYQQVFRPATLAVDDAPALGRALAAMGLRAVKVSDPLAALTHPGGVAVVSASPKNLRRLAAHLTAVRRFTASGGWIVFNGLTPKGLADYNRLVGVNHLLRPFGSTKPTLTKDGPMAIERVLFAVPRNHLTAGLSAPDVALYSSRRIFHWQQGNYTLPREFTYVVDLDNIAPFCACRFADFGNIVNGFSNADGWPLIINFPAHRDGTPYAIHLTLPRTETLVELTYQQDLNYAVTPQVSLVFDGDRASRQTFKLAANGDPQIFPIDPPRQASQVTLELAPPIPQPGKADNYGLDNLRLKVRRSPEFYRLVKPMLNIGGLVEYPRGRGGFVLCNVNYGTPDDVPGNAQKKRNLLATILHNLKAPFTGAHTVIAGANLTYTPIDLAPWANQYRGEQGWFGDRRFTFRDLPTGNQQFAGVRWKVYEFGTSPVPQAIMLGGRRVPGNLPVSVTGIAVNRKADALFFLQAARVDHRRSRRDVRQGKYEELARYVVHYADGQTADVPVRADENVANYVQPGRPTYLPGAQVAWTKPYPDQRHVAVAYMQQWNNPRPQIEITTIDLTQGRDQAGIPALLALTAATTH